MNFNSNSALLLLLLSIDVAYTLIEDCRDGIKMEGFTVKNSKVPVKVPARDVFFQIEIVQRSEQLYYCEYLLYLVHGHAGSI